MNKLERNSYSLASDLLHQIPNETLLDTLIAGDTPGNIYIDKVDNPSLAIAQFRHHIFISCLSEFNLNKIDLRGFLLGELTNQCQADNVPLLRLTTNTPEIMNQIHDQLLDLAPLIMDYQCYQFNITHEINGTGIPKEFNCVPLTKELIETDFKGKEDLLEEMCSERESVSAFLEKSFGIIALKDGNLAGWCLSEYNYKNQCEIGIATFPEYQRKGLGKAMTLTFLNLAYDLGINRVLWHCYKSNEASRNTALSAGFSLEKDEQILMLYLNRAIHLGVHGNILFDEHKYKTALDWYLKALQENEPALWIRLKAACAAAQLKQIDLGFNLLEQAIQLGFCDINYLLNNEHLKTLKDDPRWSKLINPLKSNFPA